MSGLRNHTGHRVGEWHQRAKLSTSEVHRLRFLHAAAQALGVRRGYGWLGERFKCSASTARDIVQYRTRAAA